MVFAIKACGGTKRSSFLWFASLIHVAELKPYLDQGDQELSTRYKVCRDRH